MKILRKEEINKILKTISVIAGKNCLPPTPDVLNAILEGYEAGFQDCSYCVCEFLKKNEKACDKED